ncbi:MAG: ribosome maturation factor RimM [Lachnospiraceae bacterium]|nr:ribosome maturation factor RimM [Lachnospiraceae bacterium]
MEEFLKVGIISSLHGVHGEVKVYPTTDDVKRFKKLKQVYMQTKTDRVLLEVESVKFVKQFAVLKFKGYDNPDAIQKYRECELFVERKDAVPLKKDEYYVADLIDMKVFTEDGKEFGTLKDVLPTGANDVYIIQTEEHGEVLVPAIKECIKEVDPAGQRMVIHLLEGLL